MAKYTLLSNGKANTKMSKGITEDIHIFSLNLKPHKTEIDGKIYNVCRNAKECVKICVGKNGHFSMINGSAYKAQFRKTVEYFTDTKKFYVSLVEDMQTARKYCSKKGSTAVFRLNAYSDINHLKQAKRYTGIDIYNEFNDCIFYDYTKDIPKALKNDVENYSITISYDEAMSDDKVKELVEMNENVAICFEKLPETYLGLKVIDGDKTDNRFEDEKGVIVGLKFKGSKSKLMFAIGIGFCIPKYLTH